MLKYAKESKRTLLIVDDVPMNIQVLADMLRDEYKILIATTGAQAIDIASSEQRPDLILLDVMMPDMDGYDVCRKLKAESATQDIPIIFVTSKGEAEDEERGFNLGAVDYICKPFNIAIVRARVRTHISLKLKTDLLNKLTREDQLTGIANRRGFDDALERERRRCVRDNAALSLLLIDIDYFKQYNDELGHLAGDVCLQQVAMTLQDSVRRSSDLVARYGGEEFGVLLPDTGSDAALAVAQQLIRNVGTLGLLHNVNGVLRGVSISVGGATLSGDELRRCSGEQLVHMADKKLYDAKQAGRSQACI